MKAGDTYIQTVGSSKNNIVVFVRQEGGFVRLFSKKHKFSYLTNENNFNKYYKEFKRTPVGRDKYKIERTPIR